MRLRFARIIVGTLLFALGLGVVATADRLGDKLVYAFTAAGCLVGAGANLARHRRAGRPVTWRHLANGGWLGGVVLATGIALLTGSPGAVGEAFGGALAVGLIDGYGLGLVCSGARAFQGAPGEQNT